jgi:serine/threonine protein kinase
MSQVWLARSSMDKHNFVVKIARVVDTGDNHHKLFANQIAIKNEIKWLGKLRHPGIVRLCAYNEQIEQLWLHERRVFLKTPVFLVREYLAGGTLKELVKERQKLNVELALKIIQQVAETVGYLHDQKCIHGDLHSQNILLRQTLDADSLTEEVMPVLIDFGSARSIEDQNSIFDFQRLEQEITLEWVAPETKQPLAVQPTKDIHALGVLLSQMLTGAIYKIDRSDRSLDLQPLPSIRFETSVSDQLKREVEIKINTLIRQAISASPSASPTAIEFACKAKELLKLIRPSEAKSIVIYNHRFEPQVIFSQEVMRACTMLTLAAMTSFVHHPKQLMDLIDVPWELLEQNLSTLDLDNSNFHQNREDDEITLDLSPEVSDRYQAVCSILTFVIESTTEKLQLRIAECIKLDMLEEAKIFNKYKKEIIDMNTLVDPKE